MYARASRKIVKSSLSQLYPENDLISDESYQPLTLENMLRATSGMKKT
jgi:hypothetical protein